MSDQSAATSGHDAPNAAATAPITVEQAAAVLGVSVTTVKRRIRNGSLRAEQAQRPQGTVWLVYLPAAATSAADERPPAASVAATTPINSAAADAMVSLIQATIGTVLAPLVAEQSALRQTVERQAERIAVLERENGALTARLEAATAPESPTAAPGSTLGRFMAPESPQRGFARHWRAFGAVALLVVLVIAVVLLGWRP